MAIERAYPFGKSQLTLRFADITKSTAEVIVSSDDHRLSMGGGVSAAIRAAAGSALVLDAAKCGPLRLGDVVVTTAGAMRARYVFHVITIGPPPTAEQTPDIEHVVRNATRRCLGLLRPLGVSSIAFPALGTGVAKYSVSQSAAAMAEATAEFLQDSELSYRVSLDLFARPGVDDREFVAFFEEFARRVPRIATTQANIVKPPDELPDSTHTMNRLLQLEQERQLLEDQLVRIRAASGDQEQSADLAERLQVNQRNRIEAATEEQRQRARPVRVFISYAHEDGQFRDEFVKALTNMKQQGMIQDWNDKMIAPGQVWDDEIRAKLECRTDHFLDQL